ncbi:ABC-type transporter Mla subunit MlaD [Pararhizobium capsulatum DSM 1112]|uniref:ABC-type transporter Mla subunit MlaD n=1 Tax=Pararhizobium capsulatum DSM 1112 TaxID=1121113 RepID=A0ABU0BP52_9HYPH|nr:hypothetical protein [Pararhizobium capsulatum]MDQ0320013.1 ABC-type transporter Mla subunit MlaD [Pararhizobium capsulatum DSM 1112]
MEIFPDRPGRAMGGILVLQSIAAQLLASHPNGTEFLDHLETLSAGLQPKKEDPEDLSDFLTEVARGADETLQEIKRAVQEITRTKQ